MIITKEWSRNYYCGVVVPLFTSGQEWDPCDNSDDGDGDGDGNNDDGRHVTEDIIHYFTLMSSK